LGAMDLEAVVRPVVESEGLDLVDVSFGREAGRRILRVVVDREEGVDLDSIAAASERVSRRLDVEGFDPGPYSLEVSSPGVERPLRRPDDFRRRIGERVRIRTTRPLEGSRNHTGVLADAGEDDVTIATDAGRWRVAYEEIASARVTVDWAEELKRSKR
jgi:ribosome maturation factor RimP